MAANRSGGSTTRSGVTSGSDMTWSRATSSGAPVQPHQRPGGRARGEGNAGVAPPVRRRAGPAVPAPGGPDDDVGAGMGGRDPSDVGDDARQPHVVAVEEPDVAPARRGDPGVARR